MSLLTRLALRRPLTVYILMVLAALGGFATYRALPRESFPEIRVPLILVSTPYPGSSPEDVENQVTRKIETEVKGISGIKEIRSTSFDGYALVEVEFSPKVDLDTALQKVREAVDRAKAEFPEDVEEPVINDVDFARIPIMIVTLAGGLPLDQLKELADDLKDRLEAVPGVNLVEVVGGRDREVQVFVDPRRLAGFHLGLSDVVEAIRREHLTLPGGSVDIGRLNFLVRVPGEVERAEEIARFVIEADAGGSVRVGDVATVVLGLEDERSRARLNGESAVSLTIEKRTGANILEVADAVREEVRRIEAELGGLVSAGVVADQSEDIRDMVRNLENNILSGLLLVLVILFLSLGFRPALIVSSAIPFSMLIAFLFIAAFGYTLNMVVLFSLVLVLGMLVDNAIVTVENIYRHRELGEPPVEAAWHGTREVAMPIVASTATTLSAFAPMLLWPGIVGEFMKFLPVTLILGLSASLFVALVFNPTLAARLLRRPPRPKRSSAGAGAEGPWIRRYRTLLAWCLHPGPSVARRFARNWLWLVVFAAGLASASALGLASIVVDLPMPAVWVGGLVGSAFGAFGLQGVLWLGSVPWALAGRRAWMTDRRAMVLWSVGAVLAATLAAYGVLGQGVEFFPEVEPRAIYVDLEFPPGTTLDAQDALVREIEARVSDAPDLKELLANVGSTGLSMDSPGQGSQASNKSRVTLNLRRYEDRSQNSFVTLDQVRREVRDLTGAVVKVTKPEDGPQTGKPVEIRLVGDDYRLLSPLAAELVRRLEQIPGLLNVSDDFEEGYPEVRIRVDRDAAARAGVYTRDIATAVRTALAGMKVAELRSGEDEYDITVRLPEVRRQGLDSLEELWVVDEDGALVPLRALARLEMSEGPAAIRRVDLHRVVTVSADVDHAAGYRDPDMREAAVAELETLGLPPGVRWEFGGSNEEEQESSRFLTRAFLIALCLIALILVTEFDSLVTPVTILVSVVLSLIGVLWGLILTGMPFGIIMTGIGVISLAGIVVNNAIVLCDFIMQERLRGLPRREAVIRAGVVRVRPVILTAVTTILGLIPLTTGINLDFFSLTLQLGGESSEWWGPMGVAVIFGLAVATALTLVVVPVTYDTLDDLREALASGGGRGSEDGGTLEASASSA